MSNKWPEGVDKRVRRTRHSLNEALFELGAERGLDALDVGDLAEKAGIGRSTFYAHFANKQDFLATAFVDMLSMMEKAEATEEPVRSSVLPARRVFAHVGEARAFAARVAASGEATAMIAAGEMRLREIAETNLKELKPAWSNEQRRDAAAFIAGAFVGLLRWQMEANVDASRVERTFCDLVRNALAER